MLRLSPNWAAVEQFFFEGMLAPGSWVVGAPTPAEGLFGTYRHVYPREDLLLIDSFVAPDPSQQSAGTTTIWLDRVPIWWMTYNGWHNPTVIDLVKGILRETYHSQKFLAGRGETTTSDSKVKGPHYHNTIERAGFIKFAAEERVVSYSGIQSLGYYKVSGNSLV